MTPGQYRRGATVHDVRVTMDQFKGYLDAGRRGPIRAPNLAPLHVLAGLLVIVVGSVAVLGTSAIAVVVASLLGAVFVLGILAMAVRRRRKRAPTEPVPDGHPPTDYR